MAEPSRCAWSSHGNALCNDYHDTEWGVPVHDDAKLFEMLILEGAQAGLNWNTILRKRDGYRRAFHKFNVKKVAAMKDKQLESLLHNPDIIRNRLKVYSVRKNAKAFIAIQNEFGSFDSYVWQFVDGKPIIGNRKKIQDLQSKSDISDAISKDLKKRGMSFVGSTIMYAFMQAVGLVNDHTTNCFRYRQLVNKK
ncbi:putative GMP synthase [glutamine-hydrolyzing] [Trichoplax sp. H2]|nr:putative GMP synthase [glutamine-hydrolyzing] [Trichoplax sp. H2]|eukprot:RDD39074.1 putative GMP synthase [glutamine-hydrolyzing] [Trichoplax sp. H2]